MLRVSFSHFDRNSWTIRSIIRAIGPLSTSNWYVRCDGLTVDLRATRLSSLPEETVKATLVGIFS